MAIVVDPDFTTNRRFYTCQGHTEPNQANEVQVIAWTINAAYDSATRVNDPLVGGLPAHHDLQTDLGGHTGCRLRFGPEGYLWISTGDGALSANSQSLTSLGGKILRVDKFTGGGAPGNPFSSHPRIYTYGHRNPQGLARRPGTDQMWSVEHGPDHDDEVNLLTSGDNYGWAPKGTHDNYNENVPMTDLKKFPDAIEAKWSSGQRTLATSGGIFLDGDWWDEWKGRLAVGTLATTSLRVIKFDHSGAFVSETRANELYRTYGRLRTPMIGPDKALYLTTSNGDGQDKILKVSPRSVMLITGPARAPYLEGGTALVARYTAHAPEGSTIIWRVSGPDADSFEIPNGVLRFRTPPDHDSPADHNKDNAYELTVEASVNADTAKLDTTVTVTERPPPPPPPPTTPRPDPGGGNADLHGNTPVQATQVRLGSSAPWAASTPGQINPASDIDYFTLTAPQAGVLVVETTATTATVGTVWQAGEELAHADSGGTRRNFRLSVRVQAGPAIVAVAGAGGRAGSYTLETALLVGYLENPGPNSFQSGIGVLSGWVCEAEEVEIEIEPEHGGVEQYVAAYGTERLDTLGVCGDTNNGFGLLFNWNRLGDGEHTVVAWVQGVELGRATVQVTTLGAEFLEDVEGECAVEHFPRPGERMRLVWQQNSQNFVLAPPTP